MAANGPNNFGIRDNHTRGKVADFLVEKINAGSHLSVVSAYFTIYAYEALSSDDSDIENNITLQPKGKDELKSKEPLNKSSCPRKRASSALIFMDSRFARREAESRVCRDRGNDETGLFQRFPKRAALRKVLADDGWARMEAVEAVDRVLEMTERVLNPASHGSTTPLYEEEVRRAKKLIDRLERLLATKP